MEKCINNYTDYIMRLLSDKGLYYFTVSDLATLLEASIRRAYAAVARLEGTGCCSEASRRPFIAPCPGI